MDMKKLTALIACAAMAGSLLAGCGNGSGGSASSAASSVSSAAASAPEELPEQQESQGGTAEEALEELEEQGESLQEQKPLDGGLESVYASDLGNTLENVDYVMIYNPWIFDENDTISSMASMLNTGSFSSEIITGINRADALEGDLEKPVMVSQGELLGDLDLGRANRADGRASGMDPVYSKGDVRDFYYNLFDAAGTEYRTSGSFTCVYEGDHCYIWSLEDQTVSEDAAAAMGTEFDAVIYPMDVAEFGQPRFTENGGKVNMLFYPMPMGMGGFFHPRDIFATGEYSEEDAAAYGLNLDHAIININSDMIADSFDFVKSTLGHELQHQICASDCFYYAATPWMRTWLNEAMSARAEEMINPGLKELYGFNVYPYISENFRNGQSLYNFDVSTDENLGAYGEVFLFAKYLRDRSDADVFSNIHQYWRDSFRNDVTEAEALEASVTDQFRDAIDQAYMYPPQVTTQFPTMSEEWMSKLTLDFHLSMLDMSLADLEAYEDDAHRAMLYTEVSPQSIEGGGRMVIATKDGSYTIPDDADQGLVYIGLNSDFQPVTDIIFG